MAELNNRAFGTDTYTDQLRVQGIVARALDCGGYFLHIKRPDTITYSPEVQAALDSLKQTAADIQAGIV